MSVDSSTPLRVGLAQWCAVPGDGARNLADACELIARAGAERCRLVVLPELWASGYDGRTLAADLKACAEPLDGPRGMRLAALAREHSLWLAAGSVPERDAAGRIYNTLALYDPEGRLVASHRKFHRYLPGGEDEAFFAGEGPTVCDCDPELGVVGLSVCYDGDFPETGRALREAGARLVLEPAAYEHGAESWWDRLYPAAALANGQWWILVNQSGDAGFGASRVISPLGEIVAEASRGTVGGARSGGAGPGEAGSGGARSGGAGPGEAGSGGARSGGAGSGERPEPELLVVDIDLAGEIARADAEAGSLFAERLPGAPVRRLSATAAVP